MQQSELQELGQHIQTKLQQLPNPIRLRIRCALREEALLVLAEHLLHVEPDPRQTFTTVEEALQDHTTELMKSGLVRSGIGGAKFLPVRIYLRIAGYQQPYDSFVFSLKPLATPVPVAPPTPVFVPPPVVVLPPEPEIAEVAPVEDEIEGIEDQIEDVEDEIAPVEDEIESVEDEIAPVEDEIEGVEDQIEGVEDQIEDVEDEIAPVEDEIEGVEDEIELEQIVEVAEQADLPVAQFSSTDLQAVDSIEPIAADPVADDPVADEPVAEASVTSVEPLSDWISNWIPEAPIAEFAPIEVESVWVEDLIEEPIEQPVIELEESIPEAIAEETQPTITIADLAVEPGVIDPLVDIDPPVANPPVAEPPIVEISSSQPILPFYYTPPELPQSIQNLLLEPLAEEEFLEPEPVGAIEAIDEPEISDEFEISQPEISDEPEIQPAVYELTVDEPEIIEPEIIEPEIIEPEIQAPEVISFFAPPKPDLLPQTFEPTEALKARDVFEPQVIPAALPPVDLPVDLPVDKDERATEPIVGKDVTDRLYPKVTDPTIHAVAPIAPIAKPAKPAKPTKPAKPARTIPASSSNIMMGSAIALFALLGGWYVFSRPCVLSSRCEPLEKAQQISQASFQTFQTNDSAIAITKAYEALTTANTLLKSIPSWSGQHQAAQTLLANNEANSVVIGQVVRTLKKANEAANRSQNPPHPLPEWREIQRLWREAIAALEKIPSDHAIYPFAQRKVIEYRENFDGINKRVVVEQQAQEEVENAKKTAQLAETRTGIATSPEGWQDVYTSWQAAIDLLKNVPSGAAARLEAEELLKIYQAKLTAAATRRDQENVAIAAYTEAIAQAEQAQNFQNKNQWQAAIGAWESALANVQKVAQGTTPYSQAQPLLASYQTALTNAQSGLQISEAIQAAKPALDRTCGGNPKICQYDAAPNAIRVQITYGYDAMVESAMNSAQTQGNYTAQTGVVSQVNAFLQDLSLISQSAQVPIELYNANGSKFGTYTPGTAGFSAQ